MGAFALAYNFSFY